MRLPEALDDVIHQFGKLPGVGAKTAMRQALVLTGWSKSELLEFGESVKVLASLTRCNECGFFAEEELCTVCSDLGRNDAETLCLVENELDCLAIENSGTFKGIYHVLGGVLNPLLGVGPMELNLRILPERIKNRGIKEVILAINPSVEGDATCSYIKEILPESVEARRIGFGMPMGGHLEYLDSMTISKAFENRKNF